MKKIFNYGLVCAAAFTIFSSCKKNDLINSQDAGAAGDKLITNGTPVPIGVDASATGNDVDSLMFGAVFEGHRYSIGSSQVIASLNSLHLKFLRYPGGTFAVTQYNYLNSENGTTGYTQVSTKHLDFLNGCFSRGIIPQLIMPSKMYQSTITDPNNASQFTAARDYAKRYLKHVNDTLYSINHSIPQKVTYWNMGNEDNLDDYPYYPQLAKYYIGDLNGIDGNLRLNVNFKWNDASSATTVANKLSSLSAPGYDGVFTSVLEVPDVYSGGSLTESDIETTLKNNVQLFPAANRNLQIGAWEVRSDPTNWPWMKSASIFNLRFATFVRAGAKIACFWPLRSEDMSRKERLTNSTGTAAPCGVLFNWLYDSANGKKVINSGGITSSSAVKATAFYKHYSNYSELVVFVCGMDAPLQTSVVLNISNFNVQSATGKVLTENPVITEPGTGNDGLPTGNNVPIINTVVPAVNTTAKTVQFQINKNAKWEVARIVIRTN